MKFVNKYTLLLEVVDLFYINRLIQTSDPDYFNALETHVVHLQGMVSSLDGMKIVTDEATKERYGDLFNRLEDALRRHNS
jgi:hypothetical protein